MTHPIELVVDRSKINRWQTAQILAAIQVFALVVEPSAVVNAVYYNDDLNANQIGWTLNVPKQAGSKLREYFDQLTAGASA